MFIVEITAAKRNYCGRTFYVTYHVLHGAETCFQRAYHVITTCF